MSAQKVEKYLHHVLADKRIELSMFSPAGKYVKAREWFLIGLDEINQIVNQMVVDLRRN